MNKKLAVVVNRIGGKLLPDNDQWQNRFQIKSSSSSRLYIIAQNKYKLNWGCSCMGWIRHRHCKHLDAVKPALNSLSTSKKSIK